MRYRQVHTYITRATHTHSHTHTHTHTHDSLVEIGISSTQGTCGIEDAVQLRGRALRI